MELFDTSEFFIKERPKRPTDNQTDIFLNSVVSEIKRMNISYDDEEVIYNDIKSLIPFFSSSYEMAKHLDDYGDANYDIDMDFLEYLETLYYEYDLIHRNNIRQWVISNKITNKLQEGTKLLINKTLSIKHKKGDVIYIKGKRVDEGNYIIGTDLSIEGGTIYPYELIENNCNLI